MSEAPPTRDEPIERDVACIGCDYNLRGLRPSGNCPECGEPIRRSLRLRRTPVVNEWRIQMGMAIRLEIWVAVFTVGCCALGGLVGLLNHPSLTQREPTTTESDIHMILREAIAWMRYWLAPVLLLVVVIMRSASVGNVPFLAAALLIASALRFGLVYAYLAELADRYKAPRDAWRLRGAGLLQIVTQALTAIVFMSPVGPLGWLIIVPIVGTAALSIYTLNRIANRIEPPPPDPNARPDPPQLQV